MEVVTAFIGIEEGQLFDSANILKHEMKKVRDRTFVELYERRRSGTLNDVKVKIKMIRLRYGQSQNAREMLKSANDVEYPSTRRQ